MPTPTSPVVARGRYGYAVKSGDPVAIAEAKRDLAAAKIAQYVQRVVADAPPLTPAQRQKLAALLGGGR